ncbi:MAG: diacylglycerol/lipid kinase family protein [Thermoplasmata archaeon]
MKTLFLVNPAAGNGKAKRDWPSIADLIEKNFSDYEIKFTERPLQAIELVKDAVKNGVETVVSCGGDGTLNEVINGAAESTVRIGLIPLGTGSDFGKTIGIRSPDDSLKALKGNKSVKVDISRVTFEDSGEKRFFINVLEIGFGAEVMSYVNSHTKHGNSTFTSGIFSTIWKLKRFKPGAENDSLKDVETIEVIVANGRYFGGGMLASPNSQISDGLLDVHILKPVSRITTILRLRNLVNGSYIERGYSYGDKVKAIRFGERGNLVEMDGEVVGRTPIDISIVQSGCNFIVP